MSNLGRRERLLLADLLEGVGPDAPTLCEGWRTADLAAHVVVRERRPDAAGGILIKPLAARLARVQAEYTAKPYQELVEAIRVGPPAYSPFRLPGAEDAGNTVEFFVHGEDVRRAQPDWSPRVLDAELSEFLWKRLAAMARLNARKAPAGLVLRRPDGQTTVARKGGPVVTVTGEPGELLLFMMGRQAEAHVEYDGPEDEVEQIRAAKFGL